MSSGQATTNYYAMINAYQADSATTDTTTTISGSSAGFIPLVGGYSGGFVPIGTGSGIGPTWTITPEPEVITVEQFVQLQKHVLEITEICGELQREIIALRKELKARTA
jgi:hypothetical protein